MAYESFYRYISKKGENLFEIHNGKESFGTYRRLADALYERDRLVAVDWDIDKYVEMPDTINGYIHIELPPFEKNPTYISEDKEYWEVRNRKTQKHRGNYSTLEEAQRVARIYNGIICHKKPAYRVQKRINGRTKYFGRFKTYEEAEQRVKELMESDWDVNTTQ